jgi:hypothetical protein
LFCQLCADTVNDLWNISVYEWYKMFIEIQTGKRYRTTTRSEYKHWLSLNNVCKLSMGIYEENDATDSLDIDNLEYKFWNYEKSLA